MELSTSETWDAAAIAGDLDLMNMARDYTGMTNVRVYSMSDVLQTLHDTYPGGVSQFYNEKKF